MQTKRHRLLVGTVALFVMSNSLASPILTYQFPGDTAIDESIPWTVTGGSTSDLLTTGGLVKSTALSVSGGTGNWGVSWSNALVPSGVVDLASAISSDVYFEFTFTPDVGYQATLDGGSLTIAYGFRNGTSTTGPSTTALMFSATGFTASDYAIEAGNFSNATVTYAINNAELQNLTGTQTARLYFWQTAGTGAQGGGINISQTKTISGFDPGETVVLDGTLTAVPEPTTVALGVIGFLFALIAFRRRPVAHHA